MNRRRLFQLAALSVAALAWPPAWPGAWPAPPRADALFAAIFGDAGFAARLGRLHRALDPEAGIRGRTLAAELAADRASAREGRLRERCQADFAALDVVVVDGWVMARTEADLCAAVHLDRGLA